MAVMVVMKVMAVMAVVTASDSIDVGVMMSGAGDVKGEVMVNAALLNISGGGNAEQRNSRGVFNCYTCSGSSCSFALSCSSVSDAVCLSGFEVISGTHLEGCMSRVLADRYARAYACDGYNTKAQTGYCYCSTDLCNVDINTCKAEILYKCKNGAVTVAGRLGGLTTILTLLLPLLLA